MTALDLDALIAEARNRGDALRTLFPNDGDIRDDARLYETLADALESTLAELRQEQERADEAVNHAELALASRRNAVDALAQERERVFGLWNASPSTANRTPETRKD